MSIQERILRSLSRTVKSTDYLFATEEEISVENALDLLEREYPGLKTMVSGKRVVDFGCKYGYQCIALVKKYGCTVVGIDVNPRYLEKAKELTQENDLPPSRISYMEQPSQVLSHQFDVVISQNSFEHFLQPVEVLDQMRELLIPKGKLLITFGPPWLAPYGSHMFFFCKVPWINIFFCEKTVMKVRSRYRSDGAQRYEQVESGLNRMTVGSFEKIIRSCGLKIEYEHSSCIRGCNLLAKIPLVRELFINRVSVILSKS